MDFPFNASIIVPAFNRQKILAEVLDSLNCQTGAYSNPFEIIVIDDGSTDGTQQFVQEMIMKKKYHYHLLYFNTGLTDRNGVCVARNIGIKNARGKYLLFLDDDCIPHKHWIHAHVTMLEAGEEVCIGYISHKRMQLDEELPISIDDPGMQRLQCESKINKLTELLTGNLALSRKCIQHVGVFDERFTQENIYGYDDIEFGHRLIIGGFTMRFNQNAVVYTEAKEASVTEDREDMINKSKMIWWHIVTHPQEGLSITPLLHLYAQQRIADLKMRSNEPSS